MESHAVAFVESQPEPRLEMSDAEAQRRVAAILSVPEPSFELQAEVSREM